MPRSIATLAGIVLVFLLLLGCGQREEPTQISLEKRGPAGVDSAAEEREVLRVAIGGMITPKEGFAYYRQFLDYLGQQLDLRVQFIDREDYAEINQLIQEEKVDLAFVCGGPYVIGHDRFGMDLLVAPKAYGDTVYYSYLIVPQASSAQSFGDLRDKSFVFTDPLSNTGRLVPTYMLARLGEDPETFFREYHYSGSHDKSIRAVALGLADGAAVDSLIWEYLLLINPELTSRTRVLLKSTPYGIPPVVVRANITPQLRERLRLVFEEAHLDPQGKPILDKMMIEQFVPTEDRSYDSIREMISWVESQAEPER
ncbi:phosphate/phosphite/phosphonate ABC transporter substrate-binding protein [Desulfurivibrio sp. D14AmB]|uniref:substrate-binding domain-containing protein n=1 Tax=Desulfurivibrio sp. D14AmB TaxID=3374370 RepID=UPI00376ECE90